MKEQAFVLCKLGKYKDALQKYEIQADVCARNKMDENYARSLINQAEILIKYLNKPKQAKTILEEALAVAKENNFNYIIHETEILLKGL
jgi:hypothetical protein